ncbi:MAG: hypothetical protein ACRD1V_11150 [Vicinamibacterales bacterium]
MNERVDRVAMTSDLETMESRLLKMINSAEIETRRHFNIAVEAMRTDFNVVIDGMKALGDKVDRLVERNAVEHRAFAEAIGDHEVRLRVLEAIRQAK